MRGSAGHGWSRWTAPGIYDPLGPSLTMEIEGSGKLPLCMAWQWRLWWRGNMTGLWGLGSKSPLGRGWGWRAGMSMCSPFPSRESAALPHWIICASPRFTPKDTLGAHFIIIQAQQLPSLSTRVSKLDGGKLFLLLSAASWEQRHSSIPPPHTHLHYLATSPVSLAIEISIINNNADSQGWTSLPRLCRACVSFQHKLSTNCRSWEDS